MNPYIVARRVFRKFLTGTDMNRVVRAQEQLGKNDPIRMMLQRVNEFATPETAVLAGVAADPTLRATFDAALDRKFSRKAYTNDSYAPVGEVVIGSGLHAAIYCAARVAQGHRKPWVLEGQSRVGGVFAMTRNPSFYLNSRNRPGPLSTPGRREGALNVLPGSFIQPADLSGDEYQINTDLAFAIRTTLAANANVLTGWKVKSIRGRSSSGFGNDYKYTWDLTVERPRGNAVVSALRVIVATGMGEPVLLPEQDKYDRIMDYQQFMSRLDSPFPLKGMKRIAVIGAGDSGKTVIEALNGQGPTRGSSVASLDWPNVIDWYGVGAGQDEDGYTDDTCLTRRGWQNNNRSRYQGIARLLPRSEEYDETARVQPLGERARTIAQGFDCVYVNGKVYDYAVTCLGWRQPRSSSVLDAFGQGLQTRPYLDKGLIVGGRINTYQFFAVGPAAQLEVSDDERSASPQAANIPENTVSIYRYAGKTAALAAALSAPPASR